MQTENVKNKKEEGKSCQRSKSNFLEMCVGFGVFGDGVKFYCSFGGRKQTLQQS